MKRNRIEDTIRLGLMLTQGAQTAEHPLKTDKCPSIPEFERLAARQAKWNPMLLLHVNRCSYCQLTLELFRQELGIKPWWEERRETAKKAIQLLLLATARPVAHSKGQNEVLTSLPALYAVPVAIVNDRIEDGVLDVMSVDFALDQCLRLRVRMREPQFSDADMPVELTMVTYPEGEPLRSFLLPELIGENEQRLKTSLPPRLREAWNDLRSRNELPFRFILRSSAGSANQ